MRYLTCVGKNRDKNGRVKSYFLCEKKDLETENNCQEFTPEQMKLALERHGIEVSNLTLTSNGRIISKNEDPIVKSYEAIVKIMQQYLTRELLINAKGICYKDNIDQQGILMSSLNSKLLSDFEDMLICITKQDKRYISSGITRIQIALSYAFDSYPLGCMSTYCIGVDSSNSIDLKSAAEYLCTFTVNHLRTVKRGQGYNYESTYDLTEEYRRRKGKH